MNRFRHGLVAGRFAPFHAGHQHLVAEAVRQCNRVTVQLLSEADETLPASVRAAWIRELHPDVGLVVVDVPVLDAVTVQSATQWRTWFGEIMRDHLPAPVDAVFTADQADAYDAEFLELLGGAVEVQVDPGRHQVPVTGAAVRDHPERFWSLLAPPVRAWFVHRVVLVGDDTARLDELGTRLADVLRCGWVPAPEADTGLPPLALLRRQNQIHDAAARRAARPWLVLEAPTAAVWACEKLGFGHREERVVPAPRARLEHDPPQPVARLCVLAADRPGTTRRFGEELTRQRVPWVEIGDLAGDGAVEAAVATVLAHLPELRLPSASGLTGVGGVGGSARGVENPEE